MCTNSMSLAYILLEFPFHLNKTRKLIKHRTKLNSSTEASTSARRNIGKQSLQELRKTSLEYVLQCGEKPKDPSWNRTNDLTSTYNELVTIVNELPGVNLLFYKSGKIWCNR